MMRELALGVCVACGCGAAGAQVVYAPGFVWPHSADFTPRPASDENTSNGNPDDDQAGRPAWFYEVDLMNDDAGGIGSRRPWYDISNVATVTPMIWDSRYGGSALQAWARANDSGPLMTGTGIFHMLQPPLRGQVGVARLGYPGSCEATVRITGSMLVIWTGINPRMNLAADDVAVVVRRRDGLTEALLAVRVERPANSDSVSIPVDVTTVIRPGDSVCVSHVGTGPDLVNWNYLSDGLSIKVVSNAPDVNEQPQDSAACLRGTASFHVGVTGGGKSYQWRRAGVPLEDGPGPGGSVISGAASPTLQIVGCHAGDAGVYDCVVSGACGTTFSAGASLSVCVADMNCDQAVDLLDFFAFVTCWNNADPCGDVNGSGDLDLGDFFAFFEAFNAA